jgi:hypothetical protein
MTNTSLPALYAIQYSEFDINKGAYVYYEVGCWQEDDVFFSSRYYSMF